MMTVRGKIFDTTFGCFTFFASILGFGAEAMSQPGQSLRVFSEPKSHCTLKRDGQVISELTIGRKYNSPLGLAVASLDYSSHNDVEVTCKHEGFRDGSRTLVFGAVWMSISTQPCYPPSDANDEERDAICKDFEATRGTHAGSRLHGYPLHVVIPLERLKRPN